MRWARSARREPRRSLTRCYLSQLNNLIMTYDNMRCAPIWVPIYVKKGARDGRALRMQVVCVGSAYAYCAGSRAQGEGESW